MRAYERLEAEKGTFPKTCGKCDSSYPDLKTFFEKTTAVPRDTGLAEFPADKEQNIVGVFRNCKCGSTLLVACHDRRDMSEAGEERRKNFDKVLDCLGTLGIERELARRELRKFVKGEQSEILESAGLRR